MVSDKILLNIDVFGEICFNSFGRFKLDFLPLGGVKFDQVVDEGV